MKVYVLHYEDGDYSDYRHIIIGVYQTKWAAEKELEKILKWKTEVKAYDDLKWSVLKSQGYENISWEHRLRAHKSYLEQNPLPELSVNTLDGKPLKYAPALAEWQVTETDLRT